MPEKIIGHIKQRQALNKLIIKEQLPNAIILSGPDSIGKYLVALELIEKIICLNANTVAEQLGGCCNCKNCQLLKNNNYPDIHSLDCSQEGQRSMEAIRTNLNALLMKSYTGHARVLLIRDAERISTAAANLLLKAIEESRDNSYFILVTSAVSKLPNTVRSRSQIINFNKLSEIELQEILATLLNKQAHDSDTGIWKVAGSVAQALERLDDSEQLNQIGDLFELLCTGSETTAIKIANLIHSDKNHVSAQLCSLIELSYQKMQKTSPQARAYAVLLDNLLTAERYISQRHLNSQYILTNILLNFCELISSKNTSFLKEKLLTDYLQD